MFKALVIAYNFPPMGLSGVQRTLKFVKYMNQFGWKPTVITSSGDDSIAYDELLNNEINNQNINVIRVGRSQRKVNSNSKIIKNLSNEFLRKLKSRLEQTFFIPDRKKNWAKKALKIAESLIEKDTFHVIFLTGPPFSAFHIFTKLKSKYRIPIVIDYREAWYRGYFSFYPTLVHKSLQKRMEYKILKLAEGIIVSNRKIKEKLIYNFKFLTFNDVRIITNGFDPEDFQNVNTVVKTNSRMRLLYSGIFSIYNTPKYFFEAFKLLTIEQPDIAKNIELHFVGFLLKENRKLIRKLGLQEFIYDHGFVSHAEAITKLVSSDVVWVSINRGKLTDTILPGKMYEYYAAKKTILNFIPEGAAKLTAQEYPASIICKPDDINEIKDAIIKTYNLYMTGNLTLIDDNILTNYRRDFLSEQLTKLFNQLIKVQEL
jgi:hypothetical protein